jgi:hypothetical protein
VRPNIGAGRPGPGWSRIARLAVIDSEAIYADDVVIDRVIRLVEDMARRWRDQGRETNNVQVEARGLMDLKAIRFYLYGRQNLVPPEWRSAYAEASRSRESDPDYATYLELKARFEGRSS